MVLSQLLSPLNLNEMLSSAGQTYAPRTDCEYIKLKTESLSSLLALLASWQPSGVGTNQTSLQQIVLVVWHFGLICCRDDSSMINKLDNDCPPRRERQSPVCLLSLLRWFRKCLVKDRALQDHLVTESPASELKLLLQLYQVSLRSNMATDSHSLQHIELKTRVHKNYRLAIIRELNMMCLVLVAAAQRVKRQGDEEGSLQETAPCLISQKPYVEVISKGLETVILPLLPNPSTDMEEESCQGKGEYILYFKGQEHWKVFCREIHDICFKIAVKKVHGFPWKCRFSATMSFFQFFSVKLVLLERTPCTFTISPRLFIFNLDVFAALIHSPYYYTDKPGRAAVSS